MAALDRRRTALLNYALASFDEGDLDRAQGDYGVASEFEQYQDFEANQRETVRRIDERDLGFFEQLQRLIPSMQLTGDDVIIAFDASGFFFNQGRLILVNER